MLVLSLSLTASALGGQRGVIVVDWNGGGDYSTIQEALNAAGDGDTVMVMSSVGSPAGAYIENLVFPAREITLTSDPNDPDRVAHTIIDGKASGSVVTFEIAAPAAATLDGFTIRSGLAYQGGGIKITNASPTVRHCVITGNAADEGGGVQVWNGSPMFEDCTITENTATDYGGGIACVGYVEDAEQVTLTDCTITDNAVTGDWGYGGGVYCDVVGVTATGGSISGNEVGSPALSGSSGGGLKITSCAAYLAGCTVSGNTASGNQAFGGGIEGLWATISLTGCTITDNTVTAEDFCGGGGVSASWESELTIEGGLISGNVVTGGWSLMDGGGGVYSAGGPVTITGCTIIDNEATQSAGGVYIEDGVATIRYCTIADNHAAGGGGILGYEGTTLNIRNCAITENTADVDGGGVYVDGSQTTVLGCTIAMNACSDVYGAGGGIASYSSELAVSNSILWGDTGVFGAELYLGCWSPEDVSLATVTYCDAQGGIEAVYVGADSTLEWLTGNIDADPQFFGVDGADDDFHIQATSPCLQAGDPDFLPEVDETDLDGQPRVQGCRVDMGADESDAVSPPTGDADGDEDADLADFARLQQHFGDVAVNPETPPEWFCWFDFDASGEIDFPDVVAFAQLMSPPNP
jgi:predicted outer membrane repeat protein